MVSRSSLLTWSIRGYAAFIALWLLARVLIFDHHWLAALLNTVAEYLFIPLPILLLLSVWLHRQSLVLLSLPSLAFLLLFGELFLPSFVKPANPQSGSLITAMSFNVLYNNEAYGAIVNSIQSASPDVVGFQELTSLNAPGIAQSLESQYPYGTLQNLDEGGGAGLLSRFPIETAEFFSLPPRDIALHATLRMDGSRVHIFVVHLSPNNLLQVESSKLTTELIPRVLERYGWRESEVNRLKEEVSALDEPVLLLCDCNLTDTSEAYANLSSFLQDSFREVGWGLGHTLHPPQLPFPVQRIDYVWHSEDFVALEAFVGQDGNSDHLPIVAKLQLVETP